MILEVLDFRGQQGLQGFQMSQKEDCSMILEVLEGFQRSQQDCRTFSRTLTVLAGFQKFQRSQQDFRGLGRFGILEVLVSFITGFQRSQQDLVQSQRSTLDFGGFQRFWKDFSRMDLSSIQFIEVSRVQQDSIGLRRDCRDPSMIKEVEFNMIFDVLRGFNGQHFRGAILDVLGGFSSVLDVLGFWRSQQDFEGVQQDGILAGFSRILEVLDYIGQQGLVGFQSSQQDCRDPRGLRRMLGGFQRLRNLSRISEHFRYLQRGFGRISQDVRGLSMSQYFRGLRGGIRMIQILEGYSKGWDLSRIQYIEVSKVQQDSRGLRRALQD